MTRDELVRGVKLRLGIGDSGEGKLTDEVLVDLVGQALRKFSRDRTWPWSLTSTTITVATTGLAPLPTDAVASRQVLVDDAIAEFVGFDEFLAGDGRYVWTDDGTNLRFDPTPQTAFTATLHYHRVEPALTDGNSVPTAPETHHDLIVLWAAVLGARVRRDYELAGELAGEYERELAATRGDKNNRKGQRHRVTMRADLTRARATW